MCKWLVPGALLLAFALLGCNSQDLTNLFVPAEVTKAGQVFIDDIRTGNFGPVISAVDPAYGTQLNGAVLQQLRGLFGQQPVKSMKVVGSSLIKVPNVTRYVVTYEYELPTQWLAAEIVLQTAGNHLQIEGIHAQQMRQSFEQLNAFTLSGKNIAFLIFLLIAVLVPIFVVATGFVCWRTPIPRFKWLWRIFVLLGITGFTLNWATGNVQFLPIHIDLLGAAFTRQPYGPWILEIGVPAGAILFWIRRRKWLDLANENVHRFT